MNIIAHLLPVVALLIAFIYGAKVSFKKDGILFLQIINCAVGCLLLGELFQLLLIICTGVKNDGFNLGMLGIVGSYLFFLSASYGRIDNMVDDKSRELRKYRIIPVIFPAVLIAVFLVFDLRSGVAPKQYIFNTLMLVPMAITAYFNFKHLIMPDDESGLLKAARRFNISMLFTSIMLITFMIFDDYEIRLGELITGILLAHGYVHKVYDAKRGVEKWYI